jgi:hypothetical protein
VPEFRFREVRHLQTDHDQGRRAEPPTRRRARDTVSRGDRQVAGALDEIPEAMVITLLWAERRHADDHRPFAHAAQRRIVEDIQSAGRQIRRSAAATTTRAETCRMSLRTAAQVAPSVATQEQAALRDVQQETLTAADGTSFIIARAFVSVPELHGADVKPSGSIDLAVVALFSDIHGNLPALDAVLADIARQQVDAVYCLGDLVGYAAFPNEVTERIQREGIATIIGNYDDGVGFDRDDCGCAYRDAEEQRRGQASLMWTRARVSRPRTRRSCGTSTKKFGSTPMGNACSWSTAVRES